MFSIHIFKDKSPYENGKGVCQDCKLTSYLFNLNSEYVMRNKRNVGLEEAQAGIKIAGRNNNNLRYADGTPL